MDKDDEVSRLKQRLILASKALAFYANVKNCWRHGPNDLYSHSDDLERPDSSGLRINGKVARDALKDVGLDDMPEVKWEMES